MDADNNTNQMCADILRRLADKVEAGEVTPWQYTVDCEAIETVPDGEYARYRPGPNRRAVFEYIMPGVPPAADDEVSDWVSEGADGR